ncbi:MAG: S-layer homology domain-containing protein [Treponema sp.]|nr:S-layer homology domain-containing protein [Treponema sp.]MCL2236785.1 S-layer homology domain-containing protein [Treponema sp.]
MKKIFIVVLCLSAAVFSACTSLGDIFVDSQRSHLESGLAELERAIVPLEALGPNEARSKTADIASARQMIARMERESSADADYSGRLIAWSGRLSILEGRYTEAQRLYRQSIQVSPGNSVAVILSIRLEGDPAKRLEIIERESAVLNQRASGAGELNIERGRALLELNRFPEAAGAFDTAFASGINEIYSETFRADRNRAWELRNTSGVAASTLNVLGRETITWNDCIALARDETQLLRFLTAGRTVPDNELFTRLVDRGFIPFTQDITVTQWPNDRPRPTEPVTRAGAAWFVWHLNAQARADRGMLTRYSARFSTGPNPRSPIADVPPLTPFFDSILGCVETELMSLMDGRNFRPSQPMRGADLLTILRRMDN